jgi:signal transduction histidine kinase
MEGPSTTQATPQALERAFDDERAEAIRVRSRWIWGGAMVVWGISLAWFDLAVFPSRAFALQIRAPEIAIAIGFSLWLRRPRSLRALEGWTVLAWAAISALSSAGLLVVPHEKLPAKVASLAISVMAVLALGSFTWATALATGVLTALSIFVLRTIGETQLFNLAATAFGFAFGTLVVAAAARDRLKRAEFVSRRALVDANEKLRREDELRRRLFVNLSHDFRTPLAVIQGEAALLRGHEGGEAAAALGRIEGNARSLSDLTDQILDLARVDAGQMPRRASRCDVAQAARDVAALLAPAEPGRTVTAAAPRDPSSLVALADHGHLHRILVNLAANALRHAHGEVSLVVTREGDRVVVSVTDDGPGIAPERRAAIFDRFVSFSESAGTSSGIGLPLARELAALNHGSLVLVADAPTTTFRLDLPACEGPAEEPERPAAPSGPPVLLPQGPAGAGPLAPRVLVIEDNPDMAALLERVLRSTFRVDVATSLAAGTASLSERRPQAVLCDVMLPDGSGYDLLATLGASRGPDTPPVILVSALAEIEQRVRGLAAGADDYVAKPFAPDELRGRVAAAVERADQRRRALDAQRDSLLMEIHDGVSASLARAAIILGARGGTQEPHLSLEPALDAIRDGLDEVRAISSLLAPKPGDWSALCADVRRTTADACAAAALGFEFEADEGDPLALVPVAVAHALRRVAREATTNALKHAAATTLTCRMRSGPAWCVRIEDDGRGLPDARSGGQGLSIMRRRIERLGGTITIANREAGGAVVDVVIPRPK